MIPLTINLDDRRFLAALAGVKEERAAKLANATFPRVAKDVRAEIVRKVRAKWPGVPARYARARVTINNEKRRLRVYGAGPEKGKMFLRPRWLKLEPKVPAWTGVWRTAPKRSFAVTPLGGTKTSQAGKAKAGRNFARAGKRGFKRSKAVVFERKGRGIVGRIFGKGRWSGGQIRTVKGPWTMAHLVESAVGRTWVREEMLRRMAAEAKRRLDARVAGSIKRAAAGAAAARSP